MKRDVAKELPPKIERIAACALSNDQKKVYAALLEDSRRKIAELVAAQGFQPIARQSPKRVERGRGVQDREPLCGLVLEPLKRLHKLAFGKAFGLLVAVAQDHLSTSIRFLTMYVKRKPRFF